MLILTVLYQDWCILLLLSAISTSFSDETDRPRVPEPPAYPVTPLKSFSESPLEDEDESFCSSLI